jgi:HEAT repeat protein
MQNPEQEDELRSRLFRLASDRPQIQQAALLEFLRDGPKAVPALIAALDDREVGSVGRWRILRLLGRFAPPEAVPAVLRLLAESLRTRDSVLLYAAMEALPHFHDPTIGEALLSLLDDSDSDIVKYAAVLAGQTQDVSLIPPLARLLGDNKPGIRYAAVKGLLEFQVPSARAILRNHIEDENDVEILDLLSSEKIGEDE